MSIFLYRFVSRSGINRPGNRQLVFNKLQSYSVKFYSISAAVCAKDEEENTSQLTLRRKYKTVVG